jgi:hypothetical protein
MKLPATIALLSISLGPAACTSSPATGEPETTSTSTSAASTSTASTGERSTTAPSPTTDGEGGTSTTVADSTDASTGSSSGAESSSTGAPVGCTALLCEDFDGELGIDPSIWTIDTGYDRAITLSLQSDMVVSGTQAAHAHLVDHTGGFATLRQSVTFPALADELWGRAYLYDTLSVEAGHTGYVSAYVGDARVLEIGQSQGHWQLTYYDGGGEAPHGSDGVVPHDGWVCFEWRFTRAGDNLIEIYVEGDAVDSYAAEGIEIPAFTAVGIGLDNHSANPPGNDLYIDDIAIDAARIGCAR